MLLQLNAFHAHAAAAERLPAAAGHLACLRDLDGLAFGYQLCALDEQPSRAA